MEFDKDRLRGVLYAEQKHGQSSQCEIGSEKVHGKAPEDHWAKRNEEYEQQLLTKYYDFMYGP